MSDYNTSAEYISGLCEKASYVFSGVLVAGDWLAILDRHAAACGVILGIVTFIASQIWQYKNYCAIKARNDDAG